MRTLRRAPSSPAHSQADFNRAILQTLQLIATQLRRVELRLDEVDDRFGAEEAQRNGVTVGDERTSGQSAHLADLATPVGASDSATADQAPLLATALVGQAIPLEAPASGIQTIGWQRSKRG